MQAPKTDVGYTNGVIAAREKLLLKEKVARLCELSAEDAFRMLLESGYGGGAETATNVYEYEKLISREEEKLDAFIREYAPTDAISTYLLSPRDFHNAKALLKAAYLGEDAEKMLAPAGLIDVGRIVACVENDDFLPLGQDCEALQKVCEEVSVLLKEDPSGSKVGEIFEKALYAHLRNTVKRNGVLKKILVAKTDMTNILIAFRSGEEKIALDKYLPGGKLETKQLSRLFETDTESAVSAFGQTPYSAFVETCFRAKEKGLPLTEAEKISGSYDVAYFAERKYDLENTDPFLYYVFRRRTENANVRIVFACLLAGFSESEIKKRLRAW